MARWLVADLAAARPASCCRISSSARATIVASAVTTAISAATRNGY
ncbi:MAG: hypothetical protein IPG75_22530 [Gemmatimonadetes bacterium]|nr:hypothetical protein [Gemmatimonadota bacterium]